MPIKPVGWLKFSFYDVKMLRIPRKLLFLFYNYVADVILCSHVISPMPVTLKASTHREGQFHLLLAFLIDILSYARIFILACIPYSIILDCVGCSFIIKWLASALLVDLAMNPFT